MIHNRNSDARAVMAGWSLVLLGTGVALGGMAYWAITVLSLWR